MKTAVEWLIEAMYQETYPFNPKYSKIFEQAKEIEKQQIGKAFLNGRLKEIGTGVLFDLQPLSETFDNYYNETFK
jgi:hypothetical protein